MALWIAILVFGAGSIRAPAHEICRAAFEGYRCRQRRLSFAENVAGHDDSSREHRRSHRADGFLIMILTADWTNMLRAGGVAAIVLIYCYPFYGAWQRVVTQLADGQP